MKLTDLSNIYSLFLKDGIRKYKFKNSKVKPITYKPDGKKGAIFGFRTKEAMNAVRGVVITSEEALWENEDSFTHWTPNVYRYGTYTSENRLFVKGHEDRNLKQINTFMIDIDVKVGQSCSGQDIMDRSMELGFIPTLILETPGGYQVYYVLENPWFISNVNGYNSVKIARNVSNNLRRYFAEELPVDMGCNHFGIARIPRNDNILQYNLEMTYDMQTLIDWSFQYSADNLTDIEKPKLFLLTKKSKQKDAAWVDQLLNNTQIEGDKGLLGRNSAIFTMALAYYSSGESLENCYNDMDQFNTNLGNKALKDTEVRRAVESAYSGKYHQAEQEKIDFLIESWGSEKAYKASFKKNKGTSGYRSHPSTWYKFRKDRSERKYSHKYEWKADILAFLKDKSYTYKPYFVTTKREIAEELNIPSRSLDKVLKEMQQEGRLFYSVKPGRGGGIRLATRNAIIQTILNVKKEVKEAYIEAVLSVFPVAANLVNRLLKAPKTTGKEYLQLNLGDLDTG
ncbi:hypothetical protein A5881_003898 [Enterococcus termitis]|nr:hypothetical protein A5881_003918 [Enterococcus termitis]